MKIGILTLRCGKNYGGIFQCLALQNVLKENGHDVEVISFEYKGRNSVIRKFLFFLFICVDVRRLYEFISDTVRSLHRKAKPLSPEMLKSRLVFIEKNINFTEKSDQFSIGKLASRYDAIIVGSDIVWSGLGKKYLPYFFDWEPNFKGLRISYAACSHDNKAPFFNRKKIKNLLLRFDALAVRDTTTYKMVYNTSSLKPQMVVDPVFLYDYRQFIGPAIRSEPYIFAYILGDKIKGAGGQQAVISRIKNHYGNMKVIAIVIADVSLEAETFADEVVYDASPEEWLNLLYYATFIYTDSFHGCIFALKYQKRFLGYYSSYHRSSRLKDFAERYQVDKYIVYSVEDMVNKRSVEEVIDFKTTNSIIDIYKNKSLFFLLNSMN
jgi:hypothetical protein